MLTTVLLLRNSSPNYMPNSDPLSSSETASPIAAYPFQSVAEPASEPQRLLQQLPNSKALQQVLDLTVAIPTYNGEKRLSMVLDRLRSQTSLGRIRWEVIVCDNGSTDDTAALVRRYQQNWPSQYPLHYRFAAEQGAAFARQHAVESAAGKLIAFLDDDNIPASDWVAQAYRFAQEHPQAGAFGSQIHGKFETELPEELEDIACFLAIIERGKQPHLYEPTKKILPPAAGLVVRKQAWLESVPARLFLNNKGKAAGLASEDLEAILYIQNSGWEVWYNPEMVVQHVIPNGRLRENYLTTLFRCVGLSRFHVRLLGIESWKHPLAIPAYVANDIRKLVLHRIRYGSREQLSIPEMCHRVLLKSTVASPTFLLKKVVADAIQAFEDRKHGDRQQRLTQITRAFEQDQFALYQQPVVTVESLGGQHSGQHSGQKELLLRLHNDHNEYILPSSFLPTAKRYGLMRTLDRWVIRHLFEQVTQESQRPEFEQTVALLQGSPLYSINLSAESAQDTTLTAFIAQQLAKVSLPPNLFCFEISLKTALDLPDETHERVAELHQLGCQITLDDVVPGEAITHLIGQLPLNYIKLSFTSMTPRQLKDPKGWALLRKSLQTHSVQAIAKGIESPASLEAAQAQGICYAQGYQMGRPQLLQT